MRAPSWGVDGEGRKHYICDISGEALGRLDPVQLDNFIDSNCSRCSAEAGTVQNGPRETTDTPVEKCSLLQLNDLTEA